MFFYGPNTTDTAEAIFGKEPEMAEKIKLYGFNNLTKTLSFNIYDVCYAKSEERKMSMWHT